MKTHSDLKVRSHTSKRTTGQSPQPFFRARTEAVPSSLNEFSLQRAVITGAPGDAYEREANRFAEAATSPSLTTGGLAHQVTPLPGVVAPARQSQAAIKPSFPREEKEHPIQGRVEVSESPEKQNSAGPRSSCPEKKERKDEKPLQLQAEANQPLSTYTTDEENPEPESQPQIQAQLDQGEVAGEDLQPQKPEEEIAPEPLQAQSEGVTGAIGESGAPGAPGTDFRQVIQAQQGRGEPLPEQVRQKMEIRFEADFSGVVLHTDDPAVQLSRMLSTQAFTQGQDIYFNQGRYDPTSPAGERLLAHELTHTLQQGAVAPSELQRSATEPEKDPDTLQLKSEETRPSGKQEASSALLRPELVEAIRLARQEAGKVNAKLTDSEGNRLGWKRLETYFTTAFGGKLPISADIIQHIRKVKDQKGVEKDILPSWCGIFVWWALKSAGLPVPDWKLGVSILGYVKPRQPGELPRPGDIAYREKNQHFALVTTIESPETTTGKDIKSIRIATINGNTAGEVNLGGQVQEKWEPIGHWLGFFDPVPKLDLPAVALVKTSLPIGEIPQPAQDQTAKVEEALQEEAAGITSEPKEPIERRVSPEPSAAAIEPEAVEEPAAKESEVSVEPLEPLPAAELVEPEVPATPPVPVMESTPKVEPLALAGSSDQAVSTFTTASPSQMAATQPSLGSTLDEKVNQEHQAEVEGAPVLVAQTSGKTNEGITPADQIPQPVEAQIGDGVTGAEPGPLQPESHANFGEAPSSQKSERKLDEQEGGGLLSWLRDNFNDFLYKIPTKDPGLNTHAGERPQVQLEGEADPGRMTSQRNQAMDQLRGQRDALSQSIQNNPGQQNIQPKQVKEEKPAGLNQEPAVKIEQGGDPGVADYAQAPLAADVRAKADELLQPGLQGNLTEAKQQAEEAARQRDNDKASEVNRAESETARINQQADQDQRDLVVKNRQRVARQQKEGIESAYQQVNEFNTSADREQESARKEVSDKVNESEGQARAEVEKGETEAEKKKVEGEKEAEQKRKELEKESENESWWERAASAIKSAVKAITKAIDNIFNKIRQAVKDIIEKAKNLAINLINAARNWVIEKLNKLRDWARSKVDSILKERFPGLAARINQAIDGLVDTAIQGVNAVADAAIAGVEALAKELSTALDKVLSVFQIALKAAVQVVGAVLTGDFAGALRIAIQAACDIAGIDSQPIFGFFEKASSLITRILKDPLKFVNNLMDGIGGGVRSFFKNIKKHLINGLIGWLTGALSEVAITLPENFDAKGVFSLVMQILGLTYENIKAKIIKKYPPAAKVIAAIEKGFEIIKRVITEGPSALWEMAKESLSNLKEMVLSGVRDFVISTVAKEAITWLLGLLNPAGALVKILKLLYDFVMFLVERFGQIKDFVMSAYEAVAAIASGSLGKVSQAVEDALGRSLPVVISLLASLAGLGGIGKKVKEIIAKVRKPIDALVDKLIDRGIAFAKKLVAKVKTLAKSAKEKLVNWWNLKKTFTAEDGESHSLFFSGAGPNAELMVQSERQTWDTFIKDLKIVENSPKQVKAAHKEAIKIVKKIKELKKSKKAMKTTRGIKEQTLEHEQLLTDLEKETKILMSRINGKVPVSSKPEFGTKENGFAKSMKIDQLTRIGPPGSEVSAKHPTMDILYKRLEGNRQYYVAGHLLNNNLHGPGTTWENLAPITQEANLREHHDKVEVYLKKGTEQDGIYSYEVNVDYGRSLNQGLKNKFIASNTVDDKTKAEVVEAEQYVATALHCKWKRLDTTNSQGEAKVVKGGKEDLKIVIVQSATAYKVK